jgi:hypothetical protein
MRPDQKTIVYLNLFKTCNSTIDSDVISNHFKNPFTSALYYIFIHAVMQIYVVIKESQLYGLN